MDARRPSGRCSVSVTASLPAPRLLLPVLLLAGLFPWSGLVIPGLFGLHPRESRPDLFVILWLGLPLVFFSLAGSKLPGYILPCVPPLAILMGRAADRLVNSAPPDRYLSGRVTALVGLILGAVIAATPAFLFRLQEPLWRSAIPLGFWVLAVMFLFSRRVGPDPAGALRLLRVGGRSLRPLPGEGADHHRGAVDEDRPDVERPEDRHVLQDVGEVLVGHGRAVHGHHERLLPETGDVLEDPSKVGGLHRPRTLAGPSGGHKRVYPHRPTFEKGRAMGQQFRVFATTDIGREALDRLREKGWEVDVYQCCLYYLTRPKDEIRAKLGTAMLGSPFLEKDRDDMLEVIQTVSKPCIAFKILGAGRLCNTPMSVAEAFQYTFSRIKPTDVTIVGMWPRFKDEVAENVGLLRQYGAA